MISSDNNRSTRSFKSKKYYANKKLFGFAGPFGLSRFLSCFFSGCIIYGYSSSSRYKAKTPNIRSQQKAEIALNKCFGAIAGDLAKAYQKLQKQKIG